MTRLALCSALALLAAAPLHAQRGRMAALPAPRPAAESMPAIPVVVLGDGTVLANLGRGRERLLRSCAVYQDRSWPSGVGRSQLPPAPQGGSASPAPGAKGLPPAPGLSAPPGAVGTSRVGVGSVGRTAGAGSTAVGTGTLHRPGSSWRTAGPAYLDGACYVQGRDGRLHLVRL